MDEQERQLREMERGHDALTEFTKTITDATIQTGMMAARTIILINGGATVALLAFVANFAAKSQHSLASVAHPLIYFAAGVAFGTITLGAAYFANYGTAVSLNSTKRIREHPYTQETPAVHRWRVVASVFQWISFGAGVIGLSLFVWGTWQIREAIKMLG